MAACAGGFPRSQFYDADGIRYPLVASGYFSNNIPGVNNNGPIQPLSTLDLYSYACKCDSAIIPSACGTSANPYLQYRENFCNSLKDAAGNPVTEKPFICGGNGGDVLNYNPVIAAIDSATLETQSLFDTYTAQTSEKVKTITNIGIVIALLILVAGLIYIMV